MLTDPQTITIDAVAITLNRVETGNRRSVYEDGTGNVTLTISHSFNKKRIRRMARLDVKSIVADPLTAVNDYETSTFYVIFDNPQYGITAETISDNVAGFNAWLTTAMVTSLLESQS